MKTYFYILFITLFLTNFIHSQEIWINEFSYNCADSTEELRQGDEFIEIVAPVGTNMDQYGIVFFFYSDDAYHAYYYSQLIGQISSINSNYGQGLFLVKTNLSYRLENNNPIDAGIIRQTLDSYLEDELAPAGILLVDAATGIAIHGVVYEIPNGFPEPNEILTEKYVEIPWNITLTDKALDVIRLPISDSPLSGPNGSISLIGSGLSHLWTTTSGLSRNMCTPGKINFNQSTLPVELSAFSASILKIGVKLNWKTETEVNNYGFNVERRSETSKWERISFVNGNGNSNSPKEYSYIDQTANAGKYLYRLKQIDNDGAYSYSKVVEVEFNSVMEYSLSQNFPNPFNPTTTINFTLPLSGNVKLTIFNVLGQEIKILANGFKEAGIYTFNFDASDLNSGMYIYKIETGSYTQTRKMTLVK